MGKKLKCKRCGYEWEYKGNSNWYCSCPRCKNNIRVDYQTDKQIGKIKDASPKKME